MFVILEILKQRQNTFLDYQACDIPILKLMYSPLAPFICTRIFFSSKIKRLR